MPGTGWTADAVNVLRGLCMGTADVIPGVSGGTVALILGIYERLVTALSRFDGTLLQRLRQADIRGAAAQVDLRFLAPLVMGIGSGIVLMSLVINRLLAQPDSRAVTFASFFGMIFASAVLISRTIRPGSGARAAVCWVLGILGLVSAWWIATLPEPRGELAEPSLGWLFVCGSIAICAMVLPGISGAMVLLVLGVYAHLTEIPRELLAGKDLQHNFTTLVVFGSGCAISLVLFSKFLRWLLVQYQSPTLALLCGFMFGALRKLWPFLRDLTPEIDDFKHKAFEAVMPTAFDGTVLAVLTSAVLSGGFVWVADVAIRRTRK
jgi:putative membrane protein